MSAIILTNCWSSPRGPLVSWVLERSRVRRLTTSVSMLISALRLTMKPWRSIHSTNPRSINPSAMVLRFCVRSISTIGLRSIVSSSDFGSALQSSFRQQFYTRNGSHITHLVSTLYIKISFLTNSLGESFTKPKHFTKYIPMTISKSNFMIYVLAC